MKNFSTFSEAYKYVTDYFAEHFDYVGEFDYRNNKGIIQFYNVNNLTVCHTFECTIFASEPLVASPVIELIPIPLTQEDIHLITFALRRLESTTGQTGIMLDAGTLIEYIEYANKDAKKENNGK